MAVVGVSALRHVVPVSITADWPTDMRIDFEIITALRICDPETGERLGYSTHTIWVERGAR